MEKVTITIFVEPKSFIILIGVLKILEGLELDNDYVFSPSDIVYTEAMISNYIWMNIPVELYVKFKYCYRKLKNN